MFSEWMDDHFILALLLLSVMGTILGIIGMYVIGGLLALYEFTKFIFLTSNLVGGA